MVFVESVYSRSPYTDPVNLQDYRSTLQDSLKDSEHVDRWIEFMHTALVTLQGEGVLGSFGYHVDFPENKIGFLNFYPDDSQIRLHIHSSNIVVHDVTSLVAIDYQTIRIEEGTPLRASLEISRQGEVTYSFNPTP